jgi:uncharacterized protein (DUF58 family)
MQLSSINYRQFDQLDLLARQVVEGFIIGLHKSPYHGFSVEFAEYRSYNSGDSVRNVDWKAYAKTGKMYLKKFEEETNLRCQIIMDISSSMRFPKNLESNQLNKLEFSAVSIAALNYLLKKQRDAIGLTLVSDHVVEHTPAKTNLAHQQLIYNHLYQVLNSKETEAQKTNLPACIHQVAEMIHKRSLVIIFSDFLENQDKIDELFNAVQHLKHNKHEVVVFHVQSEKQELNFEFENRPHEFVDMESGKSIKLMPNQIKEIYQEKMTNYLQELKNKFISYRIDWVVANIEDGFNEVLMTYLIKRKKMRI